MKTHRKHTYDTGLAPRTVLFVLCFFAVSIFLVPYVAFAQSTDQLSQECDFALLGTEHTIMAKVTGGGTPGTSGTVYFYSTDSSHLGWYISDAASFDENGIATFTYMHEGSPGDVVEITLMLVNPDWTSAELAAITTTWTDNDQDPLLLSCTEPSVQSLTVGGRGKLNARKKGVMRILVRSDGELDLHSVVPESVRLSGVEPECWRYRDVKFCPSGRDGFVDLYFKFRNAKIVDALEESLGRELANGDTFDLELTGSLNDGTPLEGTYGVDIIKRAKSKNKKCKKEKNYKRHRKNKIVKR